MWPVATTVARAAPHILRLDFFQDRNEGTVSGKVGVKHRPAGVRGGVCLQECGDRSLKRRKCPGPSNKWAQE